MKAILFLVLALGFFTIACTRVQPGKANLESVLSADKNVDSVLAELQRADVSNRSVRFKAILQNISDDIKAMRENRLEPDEAILSTCHKYIALANTGEASLSETKAIISSLFANRHGLTPKDSKQIQESAISILDRLKARYPDDAELYLISFYGIDMDTEKEKLNAKQMLERCLQLDPKQTRCRELLEKL